MVIFPLCISDSVFLFKISEFSGSGLFFPAVITRFMCYIDQ
jgi:hypothetical protein